LNVLLILNQLPQGCFLLRAPLEDHQHAIERQVGRRLSAVKLDSRKRMNVAAQRRPLSVIDRLG
jgi:hypothetical protein